MSKHHIEKTIYAIAEGNRNKAIANLKANLEESLKYIVEQAHKSQHTWVQDVKSKGATKFEHKGSHKDHVTVALTDDEKEVGTWYKGHGGYTHKPAEKENEHELNTDLEKD